MILKELLTENLACVSMVCSVSLNSEETGQVEDKDKEDKKRTSRPKTLSTADEQKLEVMSGDVFWDMMFTEKRLTYAKLHKNWAGLIWSNNSK